MNLTFDLSRRSEPVRGLLIVTFQDAVAAGTRAAGSKRPARLESPPG